MSRIHSTHLVTALPDSIDIYRSIVVVVINIVIDKRFRFSVFRAGSEFLTNEIPHVPEETLLWGILPAVSLSGHGLDKLLILLLLNECIARIMVSLVGMHDGGIVQVGTMLTDQVIDSVKDKVKLKGGAKLISEHLVSHGIKDRREAATAALKE